MSRKVSALVSAYMWTAGLLCFGWFCINTVVASLFFPTQVYDPWLKVILRRLFRFLFIPGVIRSVEADRQFRWPLYGLAVRRLGNIPIRHDNVFD